MEQTTLQKEIVAFVQQYVAQYPQVNEIGALWRTPLVGFADADDPYIQNLPQLNTDRHLLPQDFMPHPTVVISIFVPFLPEIANSNIGVADDLPSRLWEYAYDTTNTMLAHLCQALAEFIRSKGCDAAVPDNVTMYTDILKSNWSQRHLAYAAGLGTFGINNMLITDSGCCGRYTSVVADIPDAVTASALAQERCLYKKNGSCAKCVANCFSGALTTDGFNRELCQKMCLRSKSDCCGKCDTDIPCAFSLPGKA